MDAKELSNMLADRAAAVASYLFPDGKKSGAEWKVGSTSGESGQSLSVRIKGDKAGVWKDFATGETGDLLDLWMAVEGVSLPKAMQSAAGWLGVEVTTYKPKTFQKPPKQTGISKSAPAVEWLKTERKLSRDAVDAFRVAGNETHVAFPFIRDGETCNIKYRSIIDKKDMRVIGGCEQLLFGWHLVPENARSITICEGEIDAMSFYDYGITAMSVFSGAGNFAWLDNEFQRLEQFSEIFLCLDSDDAGKKGAATLVERLGVERCRIVTLPRKDANECLVAGISTQEIHACFENASYISPAEIKRPEDFLGDVLNEFYPEEGDNLGVMLPFPVMGDKVRLRASELSIWAGYSGHGKSMLLSQVMISAAEQGDRVCIASLEMKASKTIKRMVRQITGSQTPTPDEIKKAVEWINSKFLIYDVVGGQTVKQILDKFAYVRKRYGVQHFVVDNLMMLDVSAEDKDSQTQVVRELMTFKAKYGCHLHLVAHSRKGESEDRQPRKMDIAGSSNIVNLADNVFICWRNKPKEDGRREASDPDAILFCDKQRDGEWEGAARLWFDRHSLQYRDRENGGVLIHDVMRVPVTHPDYAETF